MLRNVCDDEVCARSAGTQIAPTSIRIRGLIYQGNNWGNRKDTFMDKGPVGAELCYLEIGSFVQPS